MGDGGCPCFVCFWREKGSRYLQERERSIAKAPATDHVIFGQWMVLELVRESGVMEALFEAREAEEVREAREAEEAAAGQRQLGESARGEAEGAGKGEKQRRKNAADKARKKAAKSAVAMAAAVAVDKDEEISTKLGALATGGELSEAQTATGSKTTHTVIASRAASGVGLRLVGAGEEVAGDSFVGA